MGLATPQPPCHAMDDILAPNRMGCGEKAAELQGAGMPRAQITVLKLFYC